MPLYSDAALEQLKEFDNLEEALRIPEQVIRLKIYRREDGTALAHVAEMRNLQSLSVTLTDVSQLLPSLAALPDLQVLHLQACNVPVFPEGILGLRNLRSISIGNCLLQNLPAEIVSLEKLEALYLAQNRIQRLPDNIGQLTRLKVLGLSYNQIEEIPTSIGRLQELETLGLGINRLEHIPEIIGQLHRLESLSLNNNKLRALPDSIRDLHKLRYLSLEHNPFESLPAFLSTMEIETLSIEGEKRPLFMDWSYRHSERPPQVALSDLKLHVIPGSPLYAPLVATMQESGLSDVSPILLGVARDAVRIETTVPDDYSQPGTSRLGGFPDLPNPGLFPKTAELHWIFLAQINLADLAPLNGYLPRTGLLSFFLDSTESLNGQVLFHQGDSRALATVRHDGADAMLSPEDDYTKAPHQVKFERYFSLPHYPPDELENENAHLSDAYEKCELLHPSDDHHINGYTFTQHKSPQQQAADKLRGKAEEWVPLLQLGWDDNVGFCFWDAGTVTFCIHQEDLRRCDFSKVHVSLETS